MLSRLWMRIRVDSAIWLEVSIRAGHNNIIAGFGSILLYCSVVGRHIVVLLVSNILYCCIAAYYNILGNILQYIARILLIIALGDVGFWRFISE